MTTEPGRFCPVCKFKNEPSAVVCAFCGSPLSAEGEKHEESTTKRVGADTARLPEGADVAVPAGHIPPEGIAIYALGHSKPVAVLVDHEFTLGRKVGEEADESIVNLAPFGAFDQGVSRQHAKIRMTAKGYEITDLDSTNGSWLNEQRLAPQVAYPLASGAQIRLGRMHLVAIYRNRDASTNPPP